MKKTENTSHIALNTYINPLYINFSMDSRYAYDENSETWPVFVLTILCIVLVPLTYKYVKGVFSSDENLEKTHSAVKPYNDEELKRFKKKSQSRIFNKQLLMLLVGYAAIFYLVQLVPEFTTERGAFDPWEILNLASSATEKEIKSHYRKLSLKFHPDKLAKDLTEAVREEMEQNFVLINKAYKALTDEVTRENFLKYGHPDGPQSVSHGIAIPKFLVEGAGSPLLVVLYVILLGVLLPLLVKSKWDSARSYTKQGIHTETASFFVEKLVDFNPSKPITSESVIELISHAQEFQALFHNKYAAEQVEELIWAHLQRRPLANRESDKLFCVSKVPTLLNGLIDIAAGFRLTELCTASVEVMAAVHQAVNPQGNKFTQISQLPYVETDKLDKSVECYTLGKLAKMPKQEAEKFLNLKGENFENAIKVASQIPIPQLISAKFEVVGESVVTPASHVVVNVKLLVKSASHKAVKSVPEALLQEPQDLESLQNPFKIAEAQPELPATISPFFPPVDERFKGWYAFLVLQKDGKLAEEPARLTKLSLDNLKAAQLGSGNDVVVGTFKLKLNAISPPDEGKYQFKMLLKSCEYFGLDLEFPIVMQVENPKDVAEEDYGIEDPDEDSLQGAMASLRGQPVKKIDEYESSSDEEEDEEDEDFSDLDTDTDAE